MQNPPTTWWEDAFPRMPQSWKPPAQKYMLYLIGYDITHPKRLHKISQTLEDYGQRAQFSLFECHLEPQHFEQLWSTLTALIDPAQDKLVAYQLDAKNAKNTHTAGIMTCSQKNLCYII